MRAPKRVLVAAAMAATVVLSSAQVARSELAPFPTALNVVPSDPKVGNCLPFGNNVDFGFSGFIYRNMPAFSMQTGAVIGFDLGGTNDVDVRRDIYFSAADHDPGPGNGNVRAVDWTKVASETQIPSNPRGNATVGDYELRYRAERTFTFGGGGLIIGFGASPPGSYRDTGCEQVGVHTSSSDPSGHFYGRFWNKPDRDTTFLDRGTFGTTFIAGFVIFADVVPPVVSATISPAPGGDGWIEDGDGTAIVTWTGTDDETGIASCDPPIELSGPGTYELNGRCTDGAGNAGSAGVTVRIARLVIVDVMPRNPVSPTNERRKGHATFAVLSGDGFDAHRLDRESLTFGATGDERSVGSCVPNGADVECRFSVADAGVAERPVFKGFADGIRVVGSDAMRIVGKR